MLRALRSISTVTLVALCQLGCGGSKMGTTGSGGSGGGAGGGGGGASGAGGGGPVGPATGVSVLQFHKSASRDGVYIDGALTRNTAAGLHVDSSFANTAIMGPVYAQPLYLAAGSGGGSDLILVATAQNRLYALDAGTGMEAWTDKQFGTPVTSGLCGRPLNPLGITGTPVIDEATRTIFFDAMTNSGANGARHIVHAVAADDGTERSGWPVDLNVAVTTGGTAFTSPTQNQRAGLALVGGRVFVPFGGHIGDCGTYHGWVVGISTTTSTDVVGWATKGFAGGIWGTSGIASDGTSVYFVTGNTEGTAGNGRSAPMDWSDGESVFRLSTSLARLDPAQTTEYFVASNWHDLDSTDTDLGGTGIIPVDVAGATPSRLIVALGKDGNGYLIDRTNLGGMDAQPVATAPVAGGAIITAASVYKTASGTYVVFSGGGSGCPGGQSGGLTAVKIIAGAPPTLSVAWCAGPANAGGAAVTASDAQGTDAIVWVVGGDNRLYGLNGDTGQAILSSTTTLGTVKKHQAPIAAKGRIFVGSDAQIWAFTP
jgi:hypothetical protein